MPDPVQKPSMEGPSLTASVPVSVGITAEQPRETRHYVRKAVPNPGRAYRVGDMVQVRSGGAAMTVQGYASNGEVACDLRGQAFELPEMLLKFWVSRPARPAPKPRRNPAKGDTAFGAHGTGGLASIRLHEPVHSQPETVAADREDQ